MPMYEYACPKCGEHFEKSLTIAEYEKKKPRCPECKVQAKHVIFATPFHSRLSLMHPRHMRGQRTMGDYKTPEGRVMK